MDPLTHTLVGASLASTKLGGKTPYATAALVIGANLPDVDVLAYAWGEDAALGFRRGWTHGVLALAVLPLLLAAGLWFWGRWRGQTRAAASPSAGWLVGLSYVAVVSHPALDWLNTYGMRWLMPFDGSWFYGDSVFIMDPWLWLILGVAWLVGREPTRGLLFGWGIFTLLILLAVGSMAPRFVPLVLVVAAVLFAVARMRVSERLVSGGRPATLGLVLAVAYSVTLMVLHERAEDLVRVALEEEGRGPAAKLMVGPVPVDPLTWDVVAARGADLEYGRFSWRDGVRLTKGRLMLSEEMLPRAEFDPTWRDIEVDGEIPGFVDWARFPWMEVETSGVGLRTVSIMDARYVRRWTTGFGSARVALPSRGAESAPSTLP